MWRPPQRIRYQPSAGRIPTREEAAASRLFSRVRIGPLELAQRTWLPALVPWRATEEGFVTDEIVDWYARFARGRPGAIVVEATGIRDVPSGPLLRIGHERFLPGLKRLVAAVREASDGCTKLFIQTIDFLAVRRRPERDKFFGSYLRNTEAHRAARPGLSDDDLRRTLATLSDEELVTILNPREMEALQFGYRERVTDTKLSHIRNLPNVLPDLFADAAVRAREAGFDGVELHYAHAYTMDSFLSRTDTRADGYGVTLEGRVRLPLEIFARVRERVGRDYVIGCRMLADECIAGGSEVDDAIYFACEFARVGMDYLSTSRGGKFDDAKQPNIGGAVYPYTGPSGYECMPQFISDERGPFGRNVVPTAAIRAALRQSSCATPVVCAGGIHNFDMAERLLADGICDIVGAARQSLADPDWFLKLAQGRGETVRQCEFTNYCEGLDQKHKPVTCKLWDQIGLDDPAVKRVDGRRRATAP